MDSDARQDPRWKRPTLVVLARATSEESLVTICKDSAWAVAGPGNWHQNCRGISNCGLAGCVTISVS